MSKTKIEYLDYCWNFYPGCLNGCSYCWAHNRARRFNKGDFTPRLRLELLLEPLKWKKPSRIGVCFTGDLFGDWVEPEKRLVLPIGLGLENWLDTISLRSLIFRIIEHCPQHTFIFLTKQPQNLVKWSPFPDNCWVGVSCTDEFDFMRHISHLEKLEVTVKFISFEPLLGWKGVQGFDTLLKQSCQWVIIGQCTPVKASTSPRIAWIEEIEKAADKAGIPVFLKNNLEKLWPLDWKGALRQEFPLVNRERVK